MNNEANLLITHKVETIKKYIISKGGNVFFFFRNKYNIDGNIEKSVFDIIDECQKMGFYYVNNILVPLATQGNGRFVDNVLYIVWLTNDLNNYVVNKDRIREKSIWKDVEWGKRAKNYNNKGKDPGNVWIPTEDDGKGTIINHILLPISNVVKRIMLYASNENENVVIELPHFDGFDCLNRNVHRIKDSAVDLFSSIPYKYEKLQKEEKKIIDARVYFDSAEDMSNIKDESISCMVTSPPYWNIKDYFKKGQIGQESYEQYLSRLETVWTECYRKLNERGTFWININTISKNKKLVPIPGDIIKSCVKIGMYFKGIIIWHKSSAIPTSDRNLADHFEYVLIFAKTKNLYLNQEWINDIHEYKNPHINYGSFWNINRKAGIIGKNYVHPAVFPVKLIERIIGISTIDGDYTLDPFLGSGTSMIASININRSFVGYEYNEEFLSLIKYRMKNECEFQSVLYYSHDNISDSKIFRND